jgi:lysophospholipase L1-like esterase
MGLTIPSGLTAGQGGGSSTTFPLTPTQQAAFNNGTALLLPKWRAKLGAVKNTTAGTSYARVLCLGNSQTLAAYSNNSTTGDWTLYSWANLLAGMFNSSGVNAGADSYLGYVLRSVGTDAAANNDSRIVAGSSWAKTSAKSIGGLFAFATTSTNTLAFTPRKSCDRFRIWYPTDVGIGTLNYNFNGGADTPINQNAAQSLTSVTANATLGANTIFYTRSSGSVFHIGTEVWDSTENSIRIINAGWSGASSVDMSEAAAAAYAPGLAIQAVAPDLTIIECEGNDLLQSISLATFQTNMQFLITKAKLSGDVVLIAPIPLEVATTFPLSTQAGYINVIKALAVSNNVPLISIYDRWVSYELNNPNGYYASGAFPINAHPSGLGYGDYAQAIFEVIAHV